MTGRGRSVVACFIGLLIALAHAGEACAHASLVRASPADGAVVPVAPPALSLTFNEPVAPLVIRLIGPDGATIAPRSVAGENNTVTVTAPANLQRGTHLLSWRVISADGHPVGGSLMFSIGAPSAQPAADADSRAERGVRTVLWAVEGRALCRALRRHRRRLLLCLVCRARFAPAVGAMAAHAPHRRADRGARIGRPAGRRCARSSARRVDAQAELGNRPRDLLWPDRDCRRLRAVCRPLRLPGGVSRASPGAWRCSASSAWGSRFRSAATPARHSRSSSAAQRCSCMPCAWRSGSGRCCRSLWARVTRSCAPRRPPSANSGASPTRSCRWSCCWCSPACGSPSFSLIASMPCGRRTMVGSSRASLPRSSCCSRSPRPTGTGWCRSSKAPVARRRGRSQSRSRSSLSSRW